MAIRTARLRDSCLQCVRSMRASFPPFLVDTGTRQLLRDGEEVPLPQKAFQLLALLIERRPRAISQKELYDHLWPDSYVGAGSLHSLVHQLRAALDDDRRKIIRTAYGFGFSFAAKVTEERGPKRQQFALIVERRRIDLTDGENIVGRSKDAAVMIDHWSVSRHHARLRIAGDDTTVEDLDSKNGTFVNGQRIESATAVLTGDEILFGRVRATFKTVETDASTRTDSSVRRRLNDQVRRT